MKKYFFAAVLAVFGTALPLWGENFFPNGNFEGDWRPTWNRMACESYALETPGWNLVKGRSGQYLQSDGSGKALELQFEAPVRNLKITLSLKGEKNGQPVTVLLNSYRNLSPLVLGKAVFKTAVTPKSFTLVPKRDNRMRYYNHAPWKLTVIPPKGAKITVDDVQCSAPLKPELRRLPVQAPLPSVAQGGTALKESVPFTVKHYGNTTQKVPFTVVLPFGAGKFKSTSEWVGVQIRSTEGKLFPAQGRIISRWPQDRSVRALAVDAVADLKSGINKMTAVPGRLGAPLRGGQKISIYAVDAEGIVYRGSFTPANVEISGPVRHVVSGWTTLKAQGKPAIPVQCRMGFFKGIPDVEMEVSLYSPFENRPFTLREAFVSIDSGKKVKHYAKLAVGKIPHKKYFLQGASTIIMPQMSERHPAALQLGNGHAMIALWPDDVKQLSLSFNLALTRRFIWSPEKKAVERFGYERTVAMAEPARYGATRFFLLPLGAVDRKNYPFAAKKIDGSFQFRYSKAGQIKAKQTGLFDYGDLPGDGGWSNLESFKDYAELLRAVVCGDHDLLNFAFDRAIHYRDIDTFKGNSLYHAGNHVGGGFSYSHSWPQGIICHYLMTGDPRSKAVVEEAAAAYMATPVNNKDIRGARSLSRYLLGLVDFYGALGNEALKKRFYAQVKFAEKLNLTPNRTDDTIFPWNGARLDPYQVWYGCCAFMEMYFLSGDKLLLEWFRREMSASLKMDFYALDLKEMWPGISPEKGLPIQLGFNSRHRGSLLYPLLVFMSQIDGKPELIRLARLAAYADWCSGTAFGGDSLEFFRLSALTVPSDEAKLVADAKSLIFQGAAAKLPNGDFSKSNKWFLNWNLHGLRQMAYDNAVDDWPLVKNKDFRKMNKERLERFAYRVSPWRYYARLLGYLDNEVYGKSAPSLLIQLSSQWALGRSLVIGGAHVKMTPGKWRVSFSFKSDKALGKQSFFRLRLFEPGYPMEFISADLSRTGNVPPRDNGPRKSCVTDRRAVIRNGKKSGWKEFEMIFDLPKTVVGKVMFYLYLAPGYRDSFTWIDDVKLEKISER
ncbi:MAG: hypothetical protein IJV93_04820 [Lentisphaeria bacterium]|nr:hypothetical protein [Lentisphaeria bacterium]